MFRRNLSWMALPSVTYKSLVAQGTIRNDVKQEAAMRHVDRAYNDIMAFYNSGQINRTPRHVEIVPPNRGGETPLGFIKLKIGRDHKEAMGGDTFHPLSKVKGLYLYGGVGCGKTYMMDLLFNEIPVQKKKRVHFHQFMLDVHKKMHETRMKYRTDLAQIDVVHECAVALIRDTEVLCFDEIVVSDIADAMIMRRLFTAFFKLGVCVVFTSNRHPDDLYKGGMNRDSFTPFIRMIKERCSIYDMNSTTDYRLTGINAKTYMFPINPANEKKFNQMFLDGTKGFKPQEDVLTVFGRDVVVPRGLNGVCMFTFAELCGGSLSTADYGVISQKYHTVYIKHIPTFSVASGDNKRRFIHMLDTFYQYKVKIVCLAEAEPAKLERTLEGITDPEELAMINGTKNSEFGQIINSEEETFQMQRCVSRLTEMQTVGYLNSKHQAGDVNMGTY